MLEIGLEVKILTKKDDEEKMISSKVADIGDETFCIHFPFSGVVFHPGDKLQMNLIRNDSRYEFETKVVRRKMENILLLELEKPEEDKVKRIQLRDYFRVPVNFYMKIVNLNDEDKNISVKLVDLSGGGAAFLYEGKEKINRDTKMVCRITLPDENDTIEVSARVMRVALQHGTKNVNKVGLKFVDLVEGERNKIVRYCFQRQVELRKKGVL